MIIICPVCESGALTYAEGKCYCDNCGNVCTEPQEPPRKIYIAGKMTGEPNYRAKFKAAAERLANIGCIVLNPSNNPSGMTHEQYMLIDLNMLFIADAAYFLRGWEDSPGAQLEKHYCEYVGKEIIMEERDIG